MHKKYTQIFTLVSAFSMIALFFSCEKETTLTKRESERPTNEHKLVEFKGLYVKHRFDTPIDQFNIDLKSENSLQFYGSIQNKKQKNLRLASKSFKTILPTEESLLKAQNKIMHNFPFSKYIEVDNYIIELLIESSHQDTLSEEVRNKLISQGVIKDVKKEIEQIRAKEKHEQEIEVKSQLQMIKSDFPLMSYVDIEKNIDIIEEYYLKALEYETLNEVALNENKYNKLEAKKIKGAKQLNSDLDYDEECIFSKVDLSRIEKGVFGVASIQARNISKKFFDSSEGGSADTRQDAFRHIIWNAFLANYYPSLSRKSRGTNFALKIANANEECGGNEIDSREMDYHNNHIGRDMWWRITDRKKILGAKVGIKRPSSSQIIEEALKLVNEKGCFLVKYKNDKFPNSELLESKTAIDIRQRIKSFNKNTVVYFNGTIPKPKTFYPDCPDRPGTKPDDGRPQLKPTPSARKIILDPFAPLPVSKCDPTPRIIHKCYRL